MSRKQRAVFAAVLVLTGVVTFANVFRFTIWGVWGRPAHPTEVFSLLGSFVLIVLGLLALAVPRFAARAAVLTAIARVDARVTAQDERRGTARRALAFAADLIVRTRGPQTRIRIARACS